MSRRQGRKVNPEVLQARFGALKELCDIGSEWYMLFDKCSRGDFHRNVKFVGDRLVFTLRNRQEEVCFDDDPIVVLESCKQLYRKIGFKTREEQKMANEKRRKQTKQGWSSVRSLGDKQLFIDRYVDRQAIIRNLSEEQIAGLQHKIYMGILNGNIINTAIQFNENRIEGIKLDG